LRRRTIALRHGGLRWLHVDDDTLVYLRVHPEGRTLVQLTRAAAGPVTLDAAALGIDRGAAALDHDDLTVEAGAVELLATSAPTARVWTLPPLHLEPITS
jgi:alpha-glucosidase